MAEMASDGRRGNEGVALWLGSRAKGEATVTHVVRLVGPGVRKGPALIEIDATLFNEVADVAIREGASLVGQVHSHGVGWSTDLSETDLTGGVRAPFYLSVVAPDYALRAETEIRDCGVHFFEPGSGYRRFSRREITARISVPTDLGAMLSVIGGDLGSEPAK